MAARSKFLKAGACAVWLLLANACNVLPGAVAGGNCQTADSRIVNTYNIYGTWKQISGYSPVRSEATLEVEYNILAVLRNGDVCKLAVRDGADTGVLEANTFGTFVQNVDLKKISLDLEQDLESSRTTPVVQYSFKGTCDETKMTWTYDDDKVEVFQYRTKSVEGVSCRADE